MSASGAAAANAQQMAMFNQSQNFQNNVNNANWEHAQAASLKQWQRSLVMNETNQDFAREMTGRQENYQTQMANTAYQRAMADMKAAGLNPMLAYQQGGNPAPSGSMAMTSGQAPGSFTSNSQGGPSAPSAINTKSDFGRAIGNAVSSAVDGMKTMQGIDLMKEQEKLTEQKRAESKAAERNLHMDSAKKIEETFRTNAEIENVKAANAEIKARTMATSALGGVHAREAGNLDRYGSRQAPDTLERLLRIIQGKVETIAPPTIKIERQPSE